MATAATISIQLEAQTATLKKGFDEAKGAINQLDSNMSGSVAKGMAIFNAGLLAVKSALGVVKTGITEVMASFDEMDKVADMAAQLGATSDQLVALGYAAQMSGSSAEALYPALQKMQNAVSEAAQGTGAGAKAFAELGLSVEALKSMSPDAQFAAISDAMSGVGLASDKTRLAMDIFGKSGGELIQLLGSGSEGLNAFGREAEDLGLLMGDAREGVAGVNDTIDKMKMAWGAFVSQIAVAVAPALTWIAESLATIVGWFNKLMGSATGEAGAFKKFSSTKTSVEIADPVAEKAKEKADAEAEATRKAMADRGKALAESMRTPIEIYRDTVAELNEMVNAGTISWEIYNRGVKKALESLSSAHKAVEDFNTPAIGAVTRNSAEGFSAVNAAKRARDDDERRHKEAMSVFARMIAAIIGSRIEFAPVKL